MRSATVIIFRPCCSQYGTRSRTRAIVPSSFITSQMTPAGMRPASRARSTAASVWPVRSSTPPSFAFSGKTWPGWTRSSGPEPGSIATWIVRAQSAAEIPVVTPSRASTATVKAVWKDDSFFAAIRSRPSSSQRSGVSARQISPRASLAMKLTASGVANCAAIVRSPSFSRLSSSQTTTIRPRRISSSASSIGEKGLAARSATAPAAGSGARGSSGISFPSFVDKALHERLHVAGDEVHLDVEAVALAGLAERRSRQRLGDQRGLDAAVRDVGDRQADPVEGDRAARHDVAAQAGREVDAKPARGAVRADRHDRADPIDVTLDEVAAEWIAGAQRRLEVHPVAGAKVDEAGQRQRLVDRVGLEGAGAALGDRQARPRDRDRVAGVELGGEGGVDAQPSAAFVAVERRNRPDLAHQPGEHRPSLPVPKPGRDQ